MSLYYKVVLYVWCDMLCVTIMDIKVIEAQVLCRHIAYLCEKAQSETPCLKSPSNGHYLIVGLLHGLAGSCELMRDPCDLHCISQLRRLASLHFDNIQHLRMG